MKQKYLGDSEQVYLCEYFYDISAPSLLILPNIGWYHVGPNRMFSQIAAQCIDNKINCFCFDYIGSGESYGTYDCISYQNMMEAYETVYRYIIENYNNSVYILGYGAGNILLKEIESKSDLQGAIFYLPHFKDVLKYKSDIYKNESAKESGYFDIRLSTKNENFLFWRGILGEIHDCTYNPIKYNLVVELCEKLEENKAGQSKAKHRLVISDEKIEIADFVLCVMNEYKENILPENWYQTVNLWPDTLYKTYYYIVKWISEQVHENLLIAKVDMKKNVVCNKMTNDNGTRELVTFQSGDRTLCGVLHLPKCINKKIPCILFLPGMGGDKVDNFMCGPRLGDQISKNGMACFRYDNRFSGATANPLTGFTWTDLIEDFKNAVAAVGTYSDNIDLEKTVLVSWSNGAKLLSYIVFNNLCGVQACCLWNPVFIDIDIKAKYADKKNMGKSMTRYKKNSQKQLVTQIGGEYLGMTFNIDNRKYDFVSYMNNISKPCKIIWGSQDIESAEYEFINNMKHDFIVESYQIESKHHLFSYDMLEIVIKETVEYLRRVVD